MTMIDGLIRNVADKIKPNATVEEKYKLRQTISEIVEWQKHSTGRPLNRFHARLLSEFNRQYQKEIRRSLPPRANYHEPLDLGF